MPAETTPMKMQYNAIKAEHPDCLLFYRLGDFYEMFADDAVLGARELNLALTTRDRGKPEDERTPMCGVPYHSAEQYISKLIVDKFALKLTEVADVFDNGIDRVKTKTEFPAKTDSNCTAKCYAAAKEACDADPECKILCDLIDMATGCMASLSIATACAIYCNF